MKNTDKLPRRLAYYLGAIMFCALIGNVLWVPTDGAMDDWDTITLFLLWSGILWCAGSSLLKMPDGQLISPLRLGVSIGLVFGTLPAITAILDAPVMYGIVVHSVVFYAIVVTFLMDDWIRRLISLVRRKFSGVRRTNSTNNTLHRKGCFFVMLQYLYAKVSGTCAVVRAWITFCGNSFHLVRGFEGGP